jgi:hypothetical protein
VIGLRSGQVALFAFLGSRLPPAGVAVDRDQPWSDPEVHP